MKVGNWCKKLSATLVAGGMMMPATVNAAAVDVNLVTNGGFESVDVATTGNYKGPLILGFTGPNLFAYSHNGSMAGTPAAAVPDYADGADPPGAGNWYFTTNNTGTSTPTDVRDPGV